MKNSSVENKKQSLFFSIFKSCEAQIFCCVFFFNCSLSYCMWYYDISFEQKIFYSRLKILFSMQPAFFILVIKTTPRKDKTKILAWNQKNNLFEFPLLLFLLSEQICPLYSNLLWMQYLQKKRIYINCAHDLDFKNIHTTHSNKKKIKCVLNVG